MRNLSPHDLSEGLLVRVGRGGIEPPNQSKFNLHTFQQLIVPINLPIFADRQISLNSIALLASVIHCIAKKPKEEKRIHPHDFSLFSFSSLTVQQSIN